VSFFKDAGIYLGVGSVAVFCAGNFSGGFAKPNFTGTYALLANDP
jgi:hypothetical protein